MSAYHSHLHTTSKCSRITLRFTTVIHAVRLVTSEKSSKIPNPIIKMIVKKSLMCVLS